MIYSNEKSLSMCKKSDVLGTHRTLHFLCVGSWIPSVVRAARSHVLHGYTSADASTEKPV